MSLRLSVRKEQLGSQLSDFYDNMYLSIIRKHVDKIQVSITLSLLMSYTYIYEAPSKARNFNIVYIWTYVWQR
jgi:hypothetical protein